jgi:hypothetical protein
MAVAQHPGLHAHALLEGLGGTLGAVGVRKVEDGTDGDDGQNDDEIDEIAEEGRQRGGQQQDYDKRVGEAAEEH